jgi:hypothetical protein
LFSCLIQSKRLQDILRTIPTGVRQTPFVRHFIVKMVIFPRQARDKHRESSQKSAVFLQSSQASLMPTPVRKQTSFSRHFMLKPEHLPRQARDKQQGKLVGKDPSWFLYRSSDKDPHLSLPKRKASPRCLDEKRSFYQDRLRTNTGKTQKRRMRFVQVKHRHDFDGQSNKHIASWNVSASGRLPDPMQNKVLDSWDEFREDIGWQNRSAACVDLDDLIDAGTTH